MLSNKKKKNEINIFDIFTYIIEKKQLIILVTFSSMMIAYLIGQFFPQKKIVKVKISEPQIELFSEYNDFLNFLSIKQTSVFYNTAGPSNNAEYVYNNNYLLF